MKFPTVVALTILGLFSSVVVVANHDNVQLRRRAQQQNQLPYELTEPCMALIQEIQGKGPDGNGVEGPGPSLACELPNGMIYSLPRQVASPAWIQEKVDQGELHSGETILEIPDQSPIDPFGQEVLLASAPTLVNPDRRLKAHHRRKLATGIRTVLAVRVVVSDGLYSQSEAFLSESVFGNGVDPINLVERYDSCSFGQLSFTKAPDRIGTSTSISNGVVTVTLPGNTAGQGDGIIRNAVTSALNTEFGVYPSLLANHVMYCLPAASMSGIAYGYINSWLTVYSDDWCNYVSSQVHELGHNLNLAHSGEGGDQYGDQSGLMGYSYGSDDSPVMCFNAPNYVQMGWVTDKTATVNPTTGSWTGILDGINEYPTESSEAVIIKVDDPTSTTDLYLMFNGQTGIQAGTQEGGNTVMITSKNGTGYALSYLEAKLGATGVYTKSDFAGTGTDLMITVNWIDGSTRAHVTILLEGSPTSAPSASPTVSPTISPTSGPTASPTTMTPTAVPTSPPTSQPTKIPTLLPTLGPTSGPTSAPTSDPTSGPTTSPTTMIPTALPTSPPTVQPTAPPTTVAPTPSPTLEPTPFPVSATPTVLPRSPTTAQPTNSPTTMSPTVSPTTVPTLEPTSGPTSPPTTVIPTVVPTTPPTVQPTETPTSAVPTISPTSGPTARPSTPPTVQPTVAPTTDAPSPSPTLGPTPYQTTATPTALPSSSPTAQPTKSPTTVAPTTAPTPGPTSSPTTAVPTAVPTSPPTTETTDLPTMSPTAAVQCSSLQGRKDCQNAGCTFFKGNCLDLQPRTDPTCSELQTRRACNDAGCLFFRGDCLGSPDTEPRTPTQCSSVEMTGRWKKRRNDCEAAGCTFILGHCL